MKVGIIGLGYVGLPLLIAFADAGHEVVGVELDQTKLAKLAAGHSYIEDIADADLARIDGSVVWTSQYAELATVDAAIIAVPTPLTPNREPDLGALISAASELARVLQSGQLVVLESTTYPGTTRERLVPLLEESGLKAGSDFFVAFSPERIDPGREDFTLRTTPKLVGGDGVEAGKRATELYRSVCDSVIEVTSPDVAEMAKLLENVFRAVNIALVNELAVICDKMAIDVWEVVEAAASKPFGFMSFKPGPGLGGHCLPVDPFYLSWRAREFGVAAEFVELAGRTNQNMPRICVERTVEALNGVGLAVSNAEIAVLGVAYKPDVGDMRESPALGIMDELAKRSAKLGYHDPFVSELPAYGISSEPLSELLPRADLTLIVTAHSSIDYRAVVEQSKQVLDFRGVTRDIEAGHLARL